MARVVKGEFAKVNTVISSKLNEEIDEYLNIKKERFGIKVTKAECVAVFIQEGARECMKDAEKWLQEIDEYKKVV